MQCGLSWRTHAWRLYELRMRIGYLSVCAGRIIIMWRTCAAMAVPGGTAFQSLAPSPLERHQAAFRKLLSDLSEHLRPEDVTRITFIRSLPKDRTSTALDTLGYLMEVGAFSHANVKPLVDLLKNVNRHDLVSDLVDPYGEEHPDEVSQSLPPGTVTPRDPLKERSNTEPAELGTHFTTSNIPTSCTEQETEATNTLSLLGGLTMNSTFSSMTQQPVKQDQNNEPPPLASLADTKLNDSGATAMTSPQKMYTQVKVRDGPPHPMKLPGTPQSESATSSMSELQRYITSSSDCLNQSNTRRAMMRVNMHEASSITTHPMITPPGTHTFPRSHRGPYLSSQASAIGIITPPTHRSNMRSCSVGRTRRSMTPPANMHKRTSAPTICGNGYETSAHGFTFHYPPPQTPPMCDPSPGDDHEDVFHYPQLPSTASHHEDLEVAGFEPNAPHVPFRQRCGSKRWFLGKLRGHRRTASVMSWSVKRDKLNEAIYKHQKEKHFKCPYDLELENAGKYPPRLTLYLHPYGFEEDAGKFLTLSVELSASVKSNIPSSAIIRVYVSASESSERTKLNEVTLECPANCRIIWAKSFLSHEELKELECDTIDLQASARLYCLS